MLDSYDNIILCNRYLNRNCATKKLEEGKQECGSLRQMKYYLYLEVNK